MLPLTTWYMAYVVNVNTFSAGRGASPAWSIRIEVKAAVAVADARREWQHLVRYSRSRRRKDVKAFLYVAMVVGTFGCATSQPIRDVVDAPIMTRSGKETLTYTEVAKAIERGGRRIGWQMSAEAPGLFTARLLRRAHLAEVEIQHGIKTYSIRYRDSSNLGASDREVHKAYNTWVDSLDKAIRTELEML